ncbi:prosaposin [Condylostylus longicornis]|uniref:prosaposin n=1 Tax=Condylostylus longicornis TaxID=2530218 RepID=UPI00244DF27D|nr:prosaposin [Condylostylus longicornis]
MKSLCFVVGTFLIGFAFLSQVQGRGLIGSSQCTWGPSYWCYNITNAKNCNAVRHCIQTVWEKQTVSEDNDSICKICLDMVKQARDQLESNETQSDIKEVFEGSCNLIPLKPVRKECIKFVDNFAPELVEALASQMNPQVVCSVAGLCNNANIDKMLEEMVTERPEEFVSTVKPTMIVRKQSLSCDECSKVADIIVQKFQKISRDDFLEHMLHACGLFNSFSDACAYVAITNFETIYAQIQKDISVKNICHLSGVCAVSYYHQHEDNVGEIDVRPLSSIGVVPHDSVEKLNDDDVACELCEQLIRHMRDVLTANTTVSEFKQVLEGICKQTKKFKDECLSIVDQYYDVIYNTLVNDLDPNGACFMIGVCKKGSPTLDFTNRPIMPLLPSSLPSKYQRETKPKKLLGADEPVFLKEEIQAMQLPIDKLMGAPNAADLIENGELCTFCEYFLHFVQEALSTPSNEDKIKKIVGNTCDKLPGAVQNECHNFVDMYGDAVIALLIQGIDPSQICPEIKLCPKNVKDMEVILPNPVEVNHEVENNKPTCPLCLFAVTEAKQLISDNRTEEHVQDVLNNLCSHMKKNLKQECLDFVKTYSKDLIEKLLSNVTPQEICEYLKLCQDIEETIDIQIIDNSDHEIQTNEILDKTIGGIDYSYNIGNIECTLCKKIVKRAESELVNTNKTKEDIIKALEKACEQIHQIKKECPNYINKFGNKIADLILEELAPEEICRQMLLCSTEEDSNIDSSLNVEIVSKAIEYDDQSSPLNGGQECVLCEFIMAKLENELKNKKTQDEIKTTVHNICKKMPKTVASNCDKFIDKYSDLIIALIDTMPPKEICTRINLCFSHEFHVDAIEEITECGVCHGTVLALYPLIKENSDMNEEDIIIEACNEIPAKYYGKCSDLIAYYGESIFNLIKRNTDLSIICQNIGKCYVDEKPLQSYHKIGGNIMKNRKKRSTNENTIVGASRCTWGPSYWCANEKNADECNSRSWCVEKKAGFAAA